MQIGIPIPCTFIPVLWSTYSKCPKEFPPGLRPPAAAKFALLASRALPDGGGGGIIQPPPVMKSMHIQGGELSELHGLLTACRSSATTRLERPPVPTN